MTELLEKNQLISIVPQDFKNSNKGKVLDVQNNFFLVETLHSPDGIIPKKIIEFYSQTKNGMLYFSSNVTEMNGNTLKIAMPRKHRFLQRRNFSRIKFNKDLVLNLNGRDYKFTSINLSAGGMKIQTNEHLDIEMEYDLNLQLLDKNRVQCKYEIIKIEKNENNSYTLSGRFKNLSNTDRMNLIQFCMRKNIENVKR